MQRRVLDCFGEARNSKIDRPGDSDFFRKIAAMESFERSLLTTSPRRSTPQIKLL